MDIFPKDVEKIIKSFLFQCDKCLNWETGPKRRCELCFPNMVLCCDCYFVSGLSHLTCLSCGKCGMCNCFGKHAHGWYVDYYGNNLIYGGQSVPQPYNINTYANNAITLQPHTHIRTPPNDDDITISSIDRINVNTTYPL
jgi:hypothetical protein